jgi:hypothetical protein
VYIEPLALYLTLDIGTFHSLTVNMAAKTINITFNPMGFDNVTYVYHIVVLLLFVLVLVLLMCLQTWFSVISLLSMYVCMTTCH